MPSPVAASALSSTEPPVPLPEGQNATTPAITATSAATAASRYGRRTRTALELGVAEDAVPVAVAFVGRHQRVEELSHVGHALTSFSFVCRFEWAACKVADTVPREIPRASAMPA